MDVFTHKIQFFTEFEGQIINLSEKVQNTVLKSSIQEGIATIFCVGSTGCISTIEYEPGLIKDFPNIMEKIAPKNVSYTHNETWKDDSGRSHIKSTLMGPSLTVPFQKEKLTLGTWQQIIFIEWDTKPRNREVVLQILGK